MSASVAQKQVRAWLAPVGGVESSPVVVGRAATVCVIRNAVMQSLLWYCDGIATWAVLQDLKTKLVTNGKPPLQHIVIISYDLVQKMQSYVKQ